MKTAYNQGLLILKILKSCPILYFVIEPFLAGWFWFISIVVLRSK